MEVEYAAIHHRGLDTYIMVPKQWPVRARSLLMALADQIITQFNQPSPVVQVCGIPTRLIRRMAERGFYYIFHKVSKEETVGAFVYNIIVPDCNDDIKIEIVSGHNFDRILWAGVDIPVTPVIQQLSRPDGEICPICGRSIDERRR